MQCFLGICFDGNNATLMGKLDLYEKSVLHISFVDEDSLMVIYIEVGVTNEFLPN